MDKNLKFGTKNAYNYDSLILGGLCEESCIFGIDFCLI